MTADSGSIAGPLGGLTILDTSANMAGPFATMILAEQGADVIKVEPPQGDVLRHIGPGAAGKSAYFANLNRGKRSVVVDLKRPAGRDVVRRLARSADVFVQNFRPGVAERLGIGKADLITENGNLIYTSISGYGDQGSFAGSPAYDHLLQAMSGIAAAQAERDGVPRLVRHGIIDKSTGYTTAQAIMAALFHRERTGIVRSIDVAMIDVALNLLWPDGMMMQTCLDPVGESRSIANTFRPTATADGYVCLVTVTDRQFAGLLRAVGLHQHLEDESLMTAQDRLRNGGAVMRKVSELLGAMSTEEVLRKLSSEDVPCSQVIELPDVFEQPAVVSRGSVTEVFDPMIGRIRQPVPAVRFDHSPAPIALAPALGEHTNAVLEDFGFTAEEIWRLRAASVLDAENGEPERGD